MTINFMYLLGCDIGSSSVKVALVEVDTGKCLYSTKSPKTELPIHALQIGWAEQDPQVWWTHLVLATQELLSEAKIDPEEIKSIGLAYQMHGLVIVDEQYEPLRPAIIWCDSRAVEIGKKAYERLGRDYSFQHLLNAPGNFTASKLAWIKDNEPALFKKVRFCLLPGDYIALKMTGEASTTISGLSEGVFWDFEEHRISPQILETLEIPRELIPPVVPTFSIHGFLQEPEAKELGLAPDTPVSYRAGDQPNNALSLGVIQSGQVAATGGTSGVVYGVSKDPVFDTQQRVNSFAHVNYSKDNKLIGVLLCINGAGSQYRWTKQVVSDQNTYQEMEKAANRVPAGSDNLCILPFGNGAERMLLNRNPGAQLFNLDFNRHSKAHMYRASLEGVAYSFAYGINVLKSLGLSMDMIRAGNDNLFQSQIFSQTLASLAQTEIQIIETTGAVGAARASGYGRGLYETLEEAVSGGPIIQQIPPSEQLGEQLQEGYERWRKHLQVILKAV